MIRNGDIATMSNIAIRVENLGKFYRLGHIVSYQTLRESLTNAMSAPFRRGRSKIEHSEDNYIWALKNVSFEVEEGEVVGIIGRNGAGKTTLLKILNRVTTPTEGHAEIRGRVGSLLEVGTGFHPELTGRENVYLNGAVLGMKRKEIDRKFDEIVEFAGVGVDKFIDTPLKRYSSGMSVRLGFAVTAHLEPDILLVDEVLAVGDYEFQKKCFGKMREVGTKGRTVLVVSHNMASIVSLCQRVILLDAGQLVMDGKTNEVIQKYLQTGASTSGEAVWPDPERAPGNDVVRLHAVRVLQDGIDGPAAEVNVSKEIRIEIELWNLREGTPLYTGIVLMDKMAIPVLQSTNSTELSLTQDCWYGRSHPYGLFRSVCCIPSDLLNEGRYSVTIIGGKAPREQMMYEPEVISFQTLVTDDPNKAYYAGTLVRPKLAWQTEYLGNGREANEHAE
jgi:lipopolysaccharide transport system ATP-binding protein